MAIKHAFVVPSASSFCESCVKTHITQSFFPVCWVGFFRFSLVGEGRKHKSNFEGARFSGLPGGQQGFVRRSGKTSLFWNFYQEIAPKRTKGRPIIGSSTPASRCVRRNKVRGHKVICFPWGGPTVKQDISARGRDIIYCFLVRLVVSWTGRQAGVGTD